MTSIDARIAVSVGQIAADEAVDALCDDGHGNAPDGTAVTCPECGSAFVRTFGGRWNTTDDIATARSIIAAHASASDAACDRGPRIEVSMQHVPGLVAEGKLIVNARYIATSFHPVWGWAAALDEVGRLQLALEKAQHDLARARRESDMLADMVPRNR